jgi:hypothetical protein
MAIKPLQCKLRVGRLFCRTYIGINSVPEYLGSFVAIVDTGAPLSLLPEWLIERCEKIGEREPGKDGAISRIQYKCYIQKVKFFLCTKLAIAPVTTITKVIYDTQGGGDIPAILGMNILLPEGGLEVINKSGTTRGIIAISGECYDP